MAASLVVSNLSFQLSDQVLQAGHSLASCLWDSVLVRPDAIGVEVFVPDNLPFIILSERQFRHHKVQIVLLCQQLWQVDARLAGRRSHILFVTYDLCYLVEDSNVLRVDLLLIILIPLDLSVLETGSNFLSDAVEVPIQIELEGSEAYLLEA